MRAFVEMLEVLVARESFRSSKHWRPTNGEARQTSTSSAAKLFSKHLSNVLPARNFSPTTRYAAAFARYMDDFKADLKSIAASGWGPETDSRRRYPAKPVSPNCSRSWNRKRACALAELNRSLRRRR